MSKIQKTIGVLMFAVVGSIGVLGTLFSKGVTSNNDAVTKTTATENLPNECANHEGNHYIAKEATFHTAGNKEFYACCKCERQYLDNPGGVWNEGSILSGELSSTHIAYVEPIHGYSPSTKMIGYYQCNACDKTSSQIMTTKDIDLSKDTHAYGANATEFVAAADEGNRGLTGGIKWSIDPSGPMEIKFPKVDYTIFSNVVFEFGTSTHTWGGSYVQLAINTEKDLLDLSGAVGIYGAIEVSFDKENSRLDITSRASTGVIKNVSITDKDVISGSKSLTGTLTLGLYRSFYLNKIVVSHTEHTLSSVATASTQVIGNKVALCEDCLNSVPSKELMTTADIDLNNGYGTHVDGLSGYHAFDGEKIGLGNGENQEGTVYLPKVNFGVYSTVTFAMQHSNLWGQLGFSSTNTFGGFGDTNPDRAISLTVTKVGDSYNASLDCEAESRHIKTVITDENVINGSNSLSLYFKLGAYSVLYLKSVAVA